jgi:hypothetical protein
MTLRLEDLRHVADRMLADAIERGAALYTRERHLAPLIGDWRDLTDAEIVDRLQRKLRQAQRLTLATGHWTGDLNRVIALKQALAGEQSR